MRPVSELNYNKVTLAITALTTVALLGGCCTERTQRTAYYSRQPAYARETTVRPPPPPPTGRETGVAQANVAQANNGMVVPLYEESVNVGKREVETGQVRLKKIVKTETVNVPVQLRREEVVIDRDNNINGSAQNQVLGQRFQEQETTIPLKREEAVIEKEVKPLGQIVVQTRFAELQTNVQAEVRKEDIDIAKQGNAENVIIGQNVHASVGGAESPGGQASAEVSSSGPITDITVLTSNDRDYSRFANRPVEFQDVKVRKIIGDKVIVLSGNNDHDIYVISTQGRPNLSEGDTVTITGTVKETSGKNGEIPEDAAQALSSQRCYIQATKIEPAK